MKSSENVQAALTTIDQASIDGLTSDTAVENLRNWLTEPRYADYRAELLQHITEKK